MLRFTPASWYLLYIPLFLKILQTFVQEIKKLIHIGVEAVRFGKLVFVMIEQHVVWLRIHTVVAGLEVTPLCTHGSDPALSSTQF